jgi:hypothetical protein
MNLLKIFGLLTFAFITVTSQSSPGNCPNGVTSCPSSSPVPNTCLGWNCTRPDMSPAPSPYPCTYGNCTRPSSSPIPCDVTAAGQNCNTKPSPLLSMSPQPSNIPPRSPLPSSSEVPNKSPIESSSPSPSEMPVRSPMESSSPNPSVMPVRSAMPSKSQMESSSPSPSEMPTRSPMPTRSMIPSPPPSQTPIPPADSPPPQKPSPQPTQSPQKSQEPPAQSQQPSSVPSRSVKPNPPINTQINFRGLNMQQVTNNTLQQIQGSISCSLNTPSSNIILQNVSFTDTTGARYNVPFDASLVNQQSASCTTSSSRSLKDSKDLTVKNVKSLTVKSSSKSLTVRGSNSLQNIRKLQATTILTVNYIIMNPSNDLLNMNETQLETLIASSPFIASVGLGAPQQSNVASDSSNNNLVTQIAAPLGAIAAIAIIAVVVQMVYYNNRKTQVINKIVYVTETPLSASKDVKVENYDRVDYMPKQIRV